MKNSKKKIRINFLTAFTLFGMIFFSGLLMQSQNAQAASTKTKALNAYKQFLSQSTISWSPSSSTKVTLSKCKFAIVYIDDNSVPELILSCGSNSNSHADGYFALYTYKNGKVTYVTNLMDDFSYYKKTGIFCAVHSGTGGYETWYFKLSKGSIKLKLYTQDERTLNYDSNGNGKIGLNYYYITKVNTTNQYLSTMKGISKSTFNKKLKKLVGSVKVKTSTSVKFYSNTSTNRSKYLK